MVFWFVTFPKQCWNKSNLKDKTCWRRGWWVKKGRCKGVDLRWRLCLRIHNQSHQHRHPYVHPAQYQPHSDLFQPRVTSRDNMVELWEERSVSCRFQIKHLPTILAMMMMTIMVVKMVVVMKMFKKCDLSTLNCWWPPPWGRWRLSGGKPRQTWSIGTIWNCGDYDRQKIYYK